MEPTKEKIIAAYEALAESYNRLIDHKPHNACYDRPNTLGLMPEVAGKSILDAACGPGKYAEILLSQGASVTGFDISPRMVELAKANNKESGTFFVHGLAAPLERLADESFDVVLCALACITCRTGPYPSGSFTGFKTGWSSQSNTHSLNTTTSSQRSILMSNR
jgi:2-polyprenyl-3-methyl-5-hydroxy-6-metoxy-1,4-benzoquinol methylase